MDFFTIPSRYASLIPQEPTQAHSPVKAEAAQASPSNLESEPRKSLNSSHIPSVALLHLLQTAFNQQPMDLQQHQAAVRSSTAWRKQQRGQGLSIPDSRLPLQKLHEAFDLINQHPSPEDSIYDQYRDGFYSTKPYRHRDDQLIQVLFDMLDENWK